VIRFLAIGSAVLMLGGCVAAAVPVAAGIGGAAALAAPALSTAITVITTGETVLSDTAKTACAVQAIANELGDPKVSADAGALCAW